MSYSTSVDDIRRQLTLARSINKGPFDPEEGTAQLWLCHAEILIWEIDRLNKLLAGSGDSPKPASPDATPARVVPLAAAEGGDTDGRRARGGLVITKAEPYSDDDDCLIAKIYRHCRDQAGPHESDAIAHLLEARSGSVYNALSKLEARRLVVRIGFRWAHPKWPNAELDDTEGEAPATTDEERLATIGAVARKLASSVRGLASLARQRGDKNFEHVATTLTGLVRELLEATGGVDADEPEADDPAEEAA